MRMTEELIDDLIKAMPHGSGIDCDYTWTKSNGKLILHNSFHNIANGGFYVGYSEFKVHLILQDDGQWIINSLSFAKSITEPDIYRKYSNSMLMEYLQDTFSYHVDGFNFATTEFNNNMSDFNYGTLL